MMYRTFESDVEALRMRCVQHLADNTVPAQSNSSLMVERLGRMMQSAEAAAMGSSEYPTTAAQR